MLIMSYLDSVAYVPFQSKLEQGLNEYGPLDTSGLWSHWILAADMGLLWYSVVECFSCGHSPGLPRREALVAGRYQCLPSNNSKQGAKISLMTE